MRLLFSLLTVLTTTYIVNATTNGRGVLYPFDISEQLTCYVEQKNLATGEVTYVPEPILRLPYGYRSIQDGQRVYLPPNTTFRVPPLSGLTSEVRADLLKTLENTPGYSSVLTSPNRPSTDPPRACDLLQADEGSAGNLKQHVEVVEEPIDVYINRENSGTWDALANRPGSTVPPIPPERNDPTSDPDIFVTEEAFSGFNFRRFYRNFINNIDEMCELWIAKCPLTPVWAELPTHYFPRYFAQGTCSGKNCSYPRGLFCEEDFTYSVHVTVLRWDCCYSAELGQLRWDCGWRKVSIPILCECTCACGPRFATTSG